MSLDALQMACKSSGIPDLVASVELIEAIYEQSHNVQRNR